MTDRQAEAGRLDSLDMLRGVAILMVILFHVSQPFSPGDLALRVITPVGNQGVQLFFMVSAVTMCMMWDARENETDRRTKFYIRRVCRIAPLYWFALVFYGLLWGTEPVYVGYAHVGAAEVALNAVFLHGFAPSAINSAVPGGWSIAIEMSFYAVFPFLARLQPSRLLLAGFAWYLVCGLGVTTWLERQHPGGELGLFIYYSLLTQFPVFLVGMLVYWVAVRRSVTHLPLIVGLALCWLAVSLVAKQYLGLNGRPFFWIGIALFALVMVPVLRWNLGNRALAFLGRLSYSMYLFHFAVLYGLGQWLGGQIGYLAASSLTLAGTVAIAMLSQRTAERWSQDLARTLVAMAGEPRTRGSASAR